MIELALALWPGLAGTMVLGLLVGFVAGLPRERVSLAAALTLLLTLAVLTGLILGERIAGDAGLWLDAAGLMLATYLMGCLSGALAKTTAFSVH